MIYTFDNVNPGNKAKIYVDPTDGSIIDPEEPDAIELIVPVIACTSNKRSDTFFIVYDKKMYMSFVLDCANLMQEFVRNQSLSKDWKFKVTDNLSIYQGKYVRWISSNQIRSLIVVPEGPDGCFCSVCKDFYPMAVPNQPDNTLKCFSCRQNPLRAYY